MIKDGENASPIRGRELKMVFDQAFPLDRTPLFKDSNIALDIKDRTNEYCFGTIGKVDDLSKLPFIRERDEAKSEPKTILPGMMNVEKFTVFCLHYASGILSSIRVQDAPSFRRLIRQHIEANLITVDEANVRPYMIDVQKKLSQFEKISEFTFITSNPNIGQTANLSSRGIRRLFEQRHLSAFKATFKIKPVDVSDTLIDELTEILSDESEEFSDFKIKGINANGDVESFDMLDPILKRAKEIVFDPTSQDYLNQIMNQLVTSIKGVLAKTN